ncbi:MAG: hypothetical protein LBN27_07860 [Prevotellaceae bacterium]|jgi:Tol biopolymer transport system component|nr:hypothetical protein [Prevotellaceae bacterium]
MAFKANAVDYRTGYVYKKDEVYIKVVSDGSGKVQVPVMQADGKTPKIAENGQPEMTSQWVCDFRWFVFNKRTHRPLFGGNGQMANFDTNQSAEKQIYDFVKQLKWQYWYPQEDLFDVETYGAEISEKFLAGKETTADGKVLYPLFTDVEDDE